MANKAFGERLRWLRDRTIMRQEDVAKILGVARSTYAKYETGESQPDPAMITRLAELYDVSADYLLGRKSIQGTMVGVGAMTIGNIEPLGEGRLPVLGTIRAGQPIEMLRDNATEWEDADPDLIRGREAFILRVSGDSMIGDNIFDGDRVVVIHTPDHSPSDICVVAIDGLEATLKRVKCHDEVCVLVPSNPAMEPMVYPAEEVHVIGVVVEVRHRLKR